MNGAGKMDIIKEIEGKIPQRIKVCFMSGLFFGFLTHMAMLVHKLPNWDDLGNYHAFGSGSEFGRWFIRYLHPLGGTWSNPWINGSITIILLAVAFCFFYEGLELRSITSAVLFPMIFMTFPSLASIMTYMFMVDFSALSICLTAVSFYLARRCRLGFLWGIFPLVFSMGIYQSHICFTISVLLMALLIDAVKVENTFKQLIKRGFSYALMLACSTVLYYVVAIVRYPNLIQTEQNGIGTMGQISLLRIPKLRVKAYLRIAKYFFLGSYSFQSSFMHVCNIAVFVVLVILFILLIRKREIYKSKGNLAFSILCVFLFPLGMSFVDVMAPEANFSTLMIYQFAFFYAAILVLYEQLAESERLFSKWVSLCGILLILLTSYGDYLVSNEAYFRMQMAYERVYGYINRILVRVESMEGYQAGDPILLVGIFDQESMNGYRMDEEKFFDFSGVAMEYGLMTPGAREDFIRIFFGRQIEYMDVSEWEEIKAAPEFQSMSVYPAEQSIRKIGSRWIVRIS